MFSNIGQNANIKFTQLMFGRANGMVLLSGEAFELNRLVATFYAHFLEKMNGINTVLNNLLRDQQTMNLLEEQKRGRFTQAVNEFQKTYQKLAAIKKVHGGTTLAKCSKLKERITKLVEVLGGSQNGIWQGLCASLVSTELWLTKIVEDLSFLGN